jgi:hypothetical protein
MSAFAESIAKPVGFEGNVGFSAENIKLYKENYKLLEVSFRQPVQVHTRYPLIKAKTYLVPLDKTHAIAHRIFPFTGHVPYTSGPVNTNETTFENLYLSVQKVAATQGFDAVY